MFALIDCNNFFVSCERVFRPDLHQKPVVVLSNNDGCVISRSNEAKALGIPMAAPAFKYQEIMEAYQVHVFSSNFVLYGDMSKRVMRMLTDFSPEIEIYSIDEAFLKLGNCIFDYMAYGLDIRSKVTRSTGIPISIGVAPTKALAKIANRIAKQFSKKTQNVYVIDSEEKRIKALKWLKIGDVWGIGHRLAKKLKEEGIENAYQFTQKTDAWVKKNMSIVGLRLKHELEGKPTLELEKTRPKKNIATTRSFERNYTELELIQERVSTFATSCGEKLRKQKSKCHALLVFLYTNRHRRDLDQYNKSIIVRLPYSTNSSIELSKFAIEGLKKIFQDGFHYKKAGVVAMEIAPDNQTQIKLFENTHPKHHSLMKAMDQINNTIGPYKIKLANQDLKRTWKMSQERLSPRYTTRLSEIITVKV